MMKRRSVLAIAPLAIMIVTLLPTGDFGSNAAANEPTRGRIDVGQSVKVLRPESLPKTAGPEEMFSGKVSITTVIQNTEPSNLNCASVTFEPSARSAWHVHPRGQLLVVTHGAGWVQEWGKTAQRISTGDLVWTAPGVKHWHGASPDGPLTHLATQESLEGKQVEWMEKVSDAQYLVAIKP